MLRMTKAALAAAAFAGAVPQAGGTAHAQWGYGSGATYLHAPMYRGFGTGLTTGSRYSLYGPALGYEAIPSYGVTPGYGSAVGGLPGFGYSAYAPATTPVVPPYGGAYPTRVHGKMEYDVYTPYGKQEIKYRYHRNGTVSVDLDD